MRPRLSIVMPCYNVENTIDVTMKSLVQQTWRDFEIVALDDQSTDSTREILEDWARREPRLRVSHNTENLGVGKTRNAALAECQGDWIGFVDPDDWLTRDFFERLVRTGDDNDLDFVRCDHVRSTGIDRRLVTAPETRRDETLDPRQSVLPILAASMVDYPFWAGVYRREFLSTRGIRFADLKTAEDRIFMWRVCLEGSRYQVISLAGYVYRRDEAPTLTQIGDSRQLDFLTAMRGTIEYALQASADRDVHVKACRQAIGLLVFHYERRKRLSPDTWYAYKARAGELLAWMPSDLLRDALVEFGSGRQAALELLQNGRAKIA